MSFIRKSIPPPDVKEGEVLTAKVVDVEYPVKGKYKEQIRFRLVFSNGYETNSWMAYYEEPNDVSELGVLSMTVINVTQKPVDSVKEVLEEVRKLGNVYVKCSGFREYNGKLYPRFKVVPNKLPPFQKSIDEKRTEPPTTSSQGCKEWLTPDFYALPEEEQQKILKKLNKQQ